MAEISMTFTRKGGLGPIGARTRRLLEVAVKKATFEVEREAKRAIMTGPKTGVIYMRGQVKRSRLKYEGRARYRRTYKAHQASAPGEAPATDTGTLVNSIRTRIKPLEGTIRVSAQYAAVLEFGGVKMAARPFLGPATIKVKSKFVAACRQAIQKGAKA